MLRAVRKSSPLPPPPEDVRKDFSEVELAFRPEDLGIRMRRSLLIVIAILFALPWTVDAQFKGEIVGQGGQKFPIAISPLRNLANAPDSAKLSEGLPMRSSMISIFPAVQGSRSFRLHRTAAAKRDHAWNVRFQRLGDHRSRRTRQRRFFGPG